MVARCPPRLRRIASGALLGWMGSACCVTPPTPRELLSLGFRAPEQTFATFQTAVRADDLETLRRCFSSGFISRNHLSSLVFRTFWEDLRQREPFLRRGITDARAAGPATVRGDRAWLVAGSHGRTATLDLVREDFCEAWAGGELVADEATDFARRTGTQQGDQGRRWMYGQVEVPAGRDTSEITELRVGREWKIDDFDFTQAPSAAKTPPEPHARHDLP